MRPSVALVVMLGLTGGCDQVFGVDRPPDAAPDAPPDAARDAPIDAPLDVSIAIASGEDDALQDPDGTTLVAYGWISLYSAGHWGGLRFALPALAPGATIDSAFLEVYVDSEIEANPTVEIAAEASAAPLALAATPHNLSTRVRSTTRVPWVATAIGAGRQRSPSIAPLLQERIDDPGWVAGSHVVLLLTNTGATSFEFRQHDLDPFFAAALVLRYTNPP